MFKRIKLFLFGCPIYKAKKQKKLVAKRKKLCDKALIKAQIKAQKNTEKFISKLCGCTGEKCEGTECNHFKKAYVFDLSMCIDEPNYRIRPARCTLSNS